MFFQEHLLKFIFPCTSLREKVQEKVLSRISQPNSMKCDDNKIINHGKTVETAMKDMHEMVEIKKLNDSTKIIQNGKISVKAVVHKNGSANHSINMTGNIELQSNLDLRDKLDFQTRLDLLES